MKEITDELKTGDNAKDVLEDYNSEACVDSLKGLNEMEFLKGMDLETMNVTVWKIWPESFIRWT